MELIHTHFANMGWQYIELKKITGLPYFVSFYGFDYESLPFRFQEWKKRYQSLYEKADGFVCEGAFGASILVNQGCDPAKVHVVHLGVETSKIPAIARTKNEGELHLLQLSNYSQKKGHIYTLQAFIKALNDCPNMTLTFVGSELENIKSKLEALVKQHNIGWTIPPEDVEALAKKLDDIALNFEQYKLNSPRNVLIENYAESIAMQKILKIINELYLVDNK